MIFSGKTIKNFVFVVATNGEKLVSIRINNFFAQSHLLVSVFAFLDGLVPLSLGLHFLRLPHFLIQIHHSRSSTFTFRR